MKPATTKLLRLYATLALLAAFAGIFDTSAAVWIVGLTIGGTCIGSLISFVSEVG